MKVYQCHLVEKCHQSVCRINLYDLYLYCIFYLFFCSCWGAASAKSFCLCLHLHLLWRWWPEMLNPNHICIYCICIAVIQLYVYQINLYLHLYLWWWPDWDAALAYSNREWSASLHTPSPHGSTQLCWELCCTLLHFNSKDTPQLETKPGLVLLLSSALNPTQAIAQHSSIIVAAAGA